MTYARGAGLVVAAALLWSLTGLAIRSVDGAGTWQILFWRSVGSLPPLLLLVAWRSKWQVGRAFHQVGLAGVLGGLALVLAFGGAIFAFQTTTVANASFLFSASPFLAAILGWLILREQVPLATWGAIGLAGVGMGIMVWQGLEAGVLAGNIAALLSALGFAVFTLTLRWGKLGDMMPTVALGGFFSALFGAGMVWLAGETLVISGRDMGLILFMGAGLLGFGMVLYTLGSRALPAADLTLLSMVEILFAPIWVWLAYEETVSGATLLGGGVIMAAIVLNALAGTRRRAAMVNPG